MKLIEVNSAERIKEFHQLPKMIYKNDPHWIPYIKQDIEKLFDPKKNKLFAEGADAIRWILSDDQGKHIGRVAAFINPKTATISALKTGGMGFFECIDDQNAANFMFDACLNWLKERGMEAMDGPINFGDRSEFWGCQITNFNEPAIYPMNYNLEYYKNLFENYGFQNYFFQYNFWRDIHVPAQPIFHRKYNQLKNDPDFEIMDIRGKNLDVVAEDFRTVYNGAWGGHAHFKPISKEAARKIFQSMKPAIDPEIVIFVFYKGEPVAFYLNLPELNQIFRHVNGDLNLIGKIKFMYYKWRKKVTRMTGMAFGVVTEWQGKGLEAALVVFGEKTIPARGVYKDTVITWVGDFNPKMLKMISNLGTTEWRTLITYRYQFDRTLPFERAAVTD